MISALPQRHANRSSLDVLHVSGRIVLVQEGRFALRMRDGGTRVFVLARQAPQSRAELGGLLGEGGSVTVQYSDAAGSRIGLAHRVHRHA
jgi:hypothetical protein